MKIRLWKLRDWWSDFWLPTICVAMIILLMYVITVSEHRKKADFMAYCQSQGNTAEACRWEWEKIRHHSSNNDFMFGLAMGLSGGIGRK